MQWAQPEQQQPAAVIHTHGCHAHAAAAPSLRGLRLDPNTDWAAQACTVQASNPRKVKVKVKVKRQRMRTLRHNVLWHTVAVQIDMQACVEWQGGAGRARLAGGNNIVSFSSSSSGWLPATRSQWRQQQRAASRTQPVQQQQQAAHPPGVGRCSRHTVRPLYR